MAPATGRVPAAAPALAVHPDASPAAAAPALAMQVDASPAAAAPALAVHPDASPAAVETSAGIHADKARVHCCVATGPSNITGYAHARSPLDTARMGSFTDEG